MSEVNKEELQKSADEKLADDVLEQVSGGQIELVKDESTCSARGTMVTRGISKGDHFA